MTDTAESGSIQSVSYLKCYEYSSEKRWSCCKGNWSCAQPCKGKHRHLIQTVLVWSTVKRFLLLLSLCLTAERSSLGLCVRKLAVTRFVFPVIIIILGGFDREFEVKSMFVAWLNVWVISHRFYILCRPAIESLCLVHQWLKVFLRFTLDHFYDIYCCLVSGCICVFF